ncbi:conserved hypothetical protein [Trichinella spiralis]|uniref:hypothetical protein n=1 Tax=Trichinella spiralis TaxID=6334 RepID=UPI0001EFDC76|nr:conserved hypothetical protein [Trichinella spiralis]
MDFSVSWTRGGEARRKNLSAPKINQPTGAGGKSNGRLIEKNRHCSAEQQQQPTAAARAAATANSSRTSALTTHTHTHTHKYTYIYTRKKSQRYRRVVGVQCIVHLAGQGGLDRLYWIQKRRRRRSEQKSFNIPQSHQSSRKQRRCAVNTATAVVQSFLKLEHEEEEESASRPAMAMFPIRCVVETVADGQCIKCSDSGATVLVDSYAIVSGFTQLSQLVDTVLAALGLQHLSYGAKGRLSLVKE